MIGYVLAAAVALAVFFFGVDQNDSSMQALLLKLFGALSVGLLLWLVVLVVGVSPARLWDAQQRSIVSLLEAISDLRDLETMIARLRTLQQEGTGFLADITEGKALDDKEGKAWMGRLRDAVAEAGQSYEARYASTTANMWLAPGNHGNLIAGLMTFITAVITDLEAERAQIRRDVRESRASR